MVLASIMEFGGSLGVGARVADTIRTKVVDTSLFTNDPAMLMLGMVCAVTASSIYLTIATRLGMPVSTTHSIMGGVIGMGVASVGVSGVQWVGSGTGTATINSGVVQVFLAGGSSPRACRGPLAPSSSSSPSTPSCSARTRCWKALFAGPRLLWHHGLPAGHAPALEGRRLHHQPDRARDRRNHRRRRRRLGVLIIAATLMPWLYRVVI